MAYVAATQQGVGPQTQSVGQAQVSHLAGQQLAGRIKKFKDSWGFVNSDSFLGDLFLHTKSSPALGNAGPGDAIMFEVAEDPQKPNNFVAVNASMIKEELASLVGQECRGWIKSFKDAWGLINSNRFEGDLFLGSKRNHLVQGGLAQGQCVSFKIAPDDKGKNGLQAVEVQLIAGNVGGMQGGMQAGMMGMMGPGMPGMAGMGGMPAMTPGMSGKPQPDAVVGRRCQGTIRTFKGEWGFIISPEFDGDLFIGKNSNPGAEALQQGDAVVFEVQKQPNGKCQAVNVQGVGTSLSHLVGQRCSGVVRKFDGNWGFITSTMFAGDLFVGLNGNKHLTMPLQLGDQVDFLVQKSCSGKSGCEAAELQVLGHGATPPENALASMQGGGQAVVNASLAALVDQAATGVVRKFDGNWGFITSEMFYGDIFVGLNGNKHLTMPLQMGDQVQFMVKKGYKGCEANDVQVLGQGATPPNNPDPNPAPKMGGAMGGGMGGMMGGGMMGGGMMGGGMMGGGMMGGGMMGGGMMGGAGQPVGNSSLAALVDQAATGVVRKFDGKWGFITSDMFHGDLFVGLNGNKHLTMPLQIGDQVQFVVKKSYKNFEATEVQVLGQGATPPNNPDPNPSPMMGAAMGGAMGGMMGGAMGGMVGGAMGGAGMGMMGGAGRGMMGGGGQPGVNASLAALEGQAATGVVRKFDSNWGFITSEMFHGDLFVGLNGNKHLTMPLQLGDQLQFVVKKSYKNFEATEVSVLGQGATPPNNPDPNAALMMGGSALGHQMDRSRSPAPRMSMQAAMGAVAGSGMGGGMMGGARIPGQMGPRSPDAMVGTLLTGTVRSYKGEWGFITSPSFDGDLFCGNKSNPHLPRTLVDGDQVQFQVRIGPGGKPNAIDVMIFS